MVKKKLITHDEKTKNYPPLYSIIPTAEEPADIAHIHTYIARTYDG